MRLTRGRPELEVGPGERLLAWATTADEGSVIGGTRDALYLPQRLPWERVEAAGWDSDSSTFRVREVGSWGEPQHEHAFTIDEPGRLLQLVRERVTASVVLQRHVPVNGRRGVRVIARRAPGRHEEPTWVFEFDEGVDPADPEVRRLAAEAMVAARDELGVG